MEFTLNLNLLLRSLSGFRLGVIDNVGLPMSNVSSKMQYQYKILKEVPVFFSLIMIFSPALANELVTMAIRNHYLQSFNFKRYLK